MIHVRIELKLIPLTKRKSALGQWIEKIKRLKVIYDDDAFMKYGRVLRMLFIGARQFFR